MAEMNCIWSWKESIRSSTGSCSSGFPKMGSLGLSKIQVKRLREGRKEREKRGVLGLSQGQIGLENNVINKVVLLLQDILSL